jgi:hypothetical protein
MSEEQKIQVWEICPWGDSLVATVESWDDVRTFIEDGEEDTEWTVRQNWLTREEINALPEFDGW